jgi:hypothetical protein
MDYRQIYRQFIADRKRKHPAKTQTRGRELHHIKPRSLGGSDKPRNLVSLTYSDHLFAHLLLARIHGGVMSSAFCFMLRGPRHKGRRSRLEYAKFRREHAENFGKLNRGKKQHPNLKAAIAEYNALHKSQSPKQKEAWKKLLASQRGKPAHPKALEAVSRKGDARSSAQKARDCAALEKARAAHTPETNAKISATLRGRPWSEARWAAQEARWVKPKTG